MSTADIRTSCRTKRWEMQPEPGAYSRRRQWARRQSLSTHLIACTREDLVDQAKSQEIRDVCVVSRVDVMPHARHHPAYTVYSSSHSRSTHTQDDPEPTLGMVYSRVSGGTRAHLRFMSLHTHTTSYFQDCLCARARARACVCVCVCVFCANPRICDLVYGTFLRTRVPPLQNVTLR